MARRVPPVGAAALGHGAGRRRQVDCGQAVRQHLRALLRRGPARGDRADVRAGPASAPASLPPRGCQRPLNAG